ncbi:MAG: hypothetical protein V2A65_08490 [Candidatus Omnitrophota bacterium]
MSKISVYLLDTLKTQPLRQVKEKAKETVPTLLAKVSLEPWEEVHRKRTADDAGRR